MREVGDQLGGSDHRPAYLSLEEQCNHQLYHGGTTRKQIGRYTGTAQAS